MKCTLSKILCFHLVCSDEYILIKFYFQNRVDHLKVNKFTVVVIFINSLFDKHYCGCPHSHP